MVKKLVSVLCICAYFGLAHAQIPQEIWKESEQIEKQIKKTSFPDRVYNIYNPQNEMFRLLGTKRSFSQNETFFFSHPYPALFRLISHF